jgi:hypothetical protein
MANRCVEFIRELLNWSAKAEGGKVNSAKAVAINRCEHCKQSVRDSPSP